MRFVIAGGHRLEFAWFGPEDNAASPIVMLHEGLGSLSLWKDFPQRLADATDRRVLAYSRYGYGASEPLAEPRGVDFMHVEALETLPELLDLLQVREPVLFGHSDGASIALIYAARSHRSVHAVIALAPHVFVERYGLKNIEAARVEFLDGDLRARLARRHDDVESAFWGWNDIWLDPSFAAWNIEALLPDIRCRVLAIQGLDDEYGTLEQIDRIARGIRHDQLTRVELADCRHSPHRDQPGAVLAKTAAFLQES
jgi:pimeloyl-ACP methyl ester carboxylesterase